MEEDRMDTWHRKAPPVDDGPSHGLHPIRTDDWSVALRRTELASAGRKGKEGPKRKGQRSRISSSDSRWIVSADIDGSLV